MDVVYPGASPAEVEQAVAIPIEQAIAPLATSVVTTSYEGRLRAWITPTDQALTEATTAIRRQIDDLKTLPDGVERASVRPIRPGSRSSLITIEGNDDASAEMVVSIANEIRPSLEALPGVLGITRPGHADEVLSIRVSTERLSALGLDWSALESALQTRMLDAGPQGGLFPGVDLKSLTDTVVGAAGGSPIFVRDVATLQLQRDPKGPNAWRVGYPLEVMRVEMTGEATTEDSLRATIHSAQGTLPPNVKVSLAGQLNVSACPRGPMSEHFDGDFDLLVAHGVKDRQAAISLAEQAPNHARPIWLWESPLSDEAGASALQALVRNGAPESVALRQWLSANHEIQLEHRSRAVAIFVTLTHPDLDALSNAARDLARASRTRNLDAFAGLAAKPGIALTIDNKRAALLGIPSATIARQVRAAIDGTTVGRIRHHNSFVEVRIEPTFQPATTSAPDPQLLAALPIRTEDGQVVPLSSVATISLSQGPQSITRRDGRRVFDVRLSGSQLSLEELRATVDEALLPALSKQHPEVQANRAQW